MSEMWNIEDGMAFESEGEFYFKCVCDELVGHPGRGGHQTLEHAGLIGDEVNGGSPGSQQAT